MKKNFLLFILFALTVSSVYASVADPIDELPYKIYFKNIKYDASTKKISFEDVYKSGEQIYRCYQLKFFYTGGATSILHVFDGGHFYTYGATNGYEYLSTEIYDSEDKKIELSYNIPFSEGGAWSTDISQAVSACLKAGEGDILIAIAGYEIAKNGDLIPYEYSEENVMKVSGCYLNNHIKVHLTSFLQFELKVFPTKVEYGSSYSIGVTYQGPNRAHCRVEKKDDDAGKWTTCDHFDFTANEARQGWNHYYSYIFNYNYHSASTDYRAIIEDEVTHEVDTSDIITAKFYYWWHDGKKVNSYQPGEPIVYPKAPACKEYELIYSSEKCEKEEKGDEVIFYQPASNVEINTVPKKYTVRFYNADYTFIASKEVECGGTVEAPADPSYSSYTFAGWSKSLDNVQSDMSVIAKYDIGNDYMLNAVVKEHKNEVFPSAGFANSETRAMVGDKMTFTAYVNAQSTATLYYQTGQWNASEKRYIWPSESESGKLVGEYTEPTKDRFFDQTIDICYDPNTKFIHPFEYRLGFRFYLLIAGTRVYSDPFEIDVYYPLYFKSLIEDGKTVLGDPIYEDLMAVNQDGDEAFSSQSGMLPARNNDTVRIYRVNNIYAAGACMNYKREVKPAYSLTSGEDKNGVAFIIAPGEEETIDVSVSKKLVVFDGVYGDGYPKVLDFTAEGFGTHNGYYAEIVSCGGQVQTMPADPTSGNLIFNGWEAWIPEDYADDDYLCVPAVSETVIGFTAKWIDPDDPVKYTVSFYEQDGTSLIEKQEVEEGTNATPPTPPAIEGYHFTGWDNSYKVVTEDRNLTALYEKDKAIYTVTFRVDGVEAWVTKVLDGDDFATIIYPEGAPVKNPTEAVVYTFAGWTPKVDKITSDITLDAVFNESPRTYQVTFLGWENEVLDVQTVAYGNAATAPKDPSHEGYDFMGWDKPYDHITGDLTVTALFEPIPSGLVFKVTVKQPEHGHITLETDYPVDLNEVPEHTVLHLSVEGQGGYEFVKWMDGNTESKRDLEVTEDLKISAVLAKPEEGIEETSVRAAAVKMVRNGQLFILRNGILYDATGMEIR